MRAILRFNAVGRSRIQRHQHHHHHSTLISLSPNEKCLYGNNPHVWAPVRSVVPSRRIFNWLKKKQSLADVSLDPEDLAFRNEAERLGARFDPVKKKAEGPPNEREELDLDDVEDPLKPSLRVQELLFQMNRKFANLNIPFWHSYQVEGAKVTINTDIAEITVCDMSEPFPSSESQQLRLHLGHVVDSDTQVLPHQRMDSYLTELLEGEGDSQPIAFMFLQEYYLLSDYQEPQLITNMELINKLVWLSPNVVSIAVHDKGISAKYFLEKASVEATEIDIKHLVNIHKLIAKMKPKK